jgi:hypothetical protein
VRRSDRPASSPTGKRCGFTRRRTPAWKARQPRARAVAGRVQRLRPAHAPPVAQRGREQRLVGRIGLEAPPTRGIGRIDHLRRAVGQGHRLVDQHVGGEPSGVGIGLPPAIASHLQQPGGRGLRRLLGDLHARRPLARRLAHRGQLVDGAERRLVVRGDELGPDAPDRDPRALQLERGDDRLVEIVGRHDPDLGQPRLVEQPPRLDAEVREVAGVQSHRGQAVPALAQRQTHRDRVAHAVERVVRVDEQGDVVGQRPRVGLERLALVFERHHPAVRVRAADRDAEALPGEHIRGRGAAADVRRPRGRQSPIRPLRAPQPELDHRIVAGGQADARGLGGDERGKAGVHQERRLDQLRLQQGAAHAQQRLVGKDDLALGHRVDVQRQPHRAERVEEGAREEGAAVVAAQRLEVCEVVGLEAQRLEIRQRRLQPARHGVAAAEGGGAEVEVERGLLLSPPGAPVAERHRELVEVGEERGAGGVGRHAGGRYVDCPGTASRRAPTTRRTRRDPATAASAASTPGA